MWRSLTIVLGVTAALLAPAAASAAEQNTCWPANSRGYLKSDQVRVFSLTKATRHAEGKGSRNFPAGSYVGCNLKSRGWHFLYADSYDKNPPLLGAIAGHFVALYVNHNCGACATPPTDMFLRNMQTNQVWTYETHNEDASDDFRIHQLILARNATLAYGYDQLQGGPQTPTVVTRQIKRNTVSGRHSNRVVLDSGPSVDSASLRLDGTTLRWTNAGQPREAPLNP